MAEIHDLHEREKLRNVLNDLFQYVDDLFWKTLDEKDVFIYKKCILEIRQSISEFTEDIIREIQYHGSFAEEHTDNEEIQTVYASGLVNLVCEEKSPEQKEIIDKLKYLTEIHIDNLDIQAIYEEVIE